MGQCPPSTLPAQGEIIPTVTNLQPNEVPPSEGPIDSESDTRLSDFEKNILYLHNRTRANAGLAPLKWNSSYATLAKEWNETLKNEECQIRHPLKSDSEKNTFLPNNMGQNLYSGFQTGNPMTSDEVAKGAVSGWYNECSDYVPPKKGQSIPDNFSKVGHFTQVQWKDAREVGCHELSCPSTIDGTDAFGSVVTCNYDKGNVGGQFNEQVKFKDCPLTL